MISRKELWIGACSPFLGWSLSNLAWAALVHFVTHSDWQAIVAGVAVITLIFGMEGAFRIIKRIESTYETQIVALKRDGDKAWEKKQQEAKEQRKKKVREMVSDALRVVREFGRSEADLCQELKDCSPIEIEEAIRYWETEKMLRLGSADRWVWVSSTVSQGMPGRFKTRF